MADMGALERLLILSPFRTWFQGPEVNAFRRWSALEPGGTLLEVGCGNGASTRLLAERLRPRRLVAFDYDPALVDMARRRVRRLPPQVAMDLTVADAARMPFAGGQFDAAFEVGVIHHVPEWQTMLREVARVLRPGGLLVFAEPSRGRLTRGLYRIFPHDPDSMFSPEELAKALAEAGLEPRPPFRWLPLWDLAGLARRAD